MKEVDPCAGAVRAGNRHGPDVTRLVLAAIDGSKALSRACRRRLSLRTP